MDPDQSGTRRRSPGPSGVADDDRSTTFESVDFARDDSFRAVLALIREFHDMAEPATVPGARCKTSLASAYGLAADSYPAFSLPLSPLLSTLLVDINSDLSKFMEDQTVHGFLPVPGRRQRRYYGTSTSSFPGPYSVPPGMTSITLEKASEVRKRSVSLSTSQVSSMETMLSGMCEVASWLDWWLSTCGGYRDLLPVESRADFERLMMSGSRALEFLASQGCTTLGNLVLSRRDALLADVRSTVPAEEVARLRYSPLPLSASIFPHALLDSALLKMRAAASDALVQRTLHPPRIPRKPAASGQASGSTTARSGQASTSGAAQASKQSAASSSSGQSGQGKKKGKGKAPFSSSSRGSGRSGGKGKGGIRFGTPAPDLHLYSDASSSGWGAHLLDQNVSGVWSAQEKLLHINLLEMKALFLALQAFQEDVAGHHVTAMCDNSMVVAYVNKQGGTVSRPLCLLTSRLLRWTESFDVHLEARYLPGESNVLADVLSRRGQVVGTEWSLHPQVARALLRAWGNPSIDLFATCLNAKLPLYCSLVPDPQAVFEDAFRHPWDDLDLYAFPPFALVGRVIARVQQSSRVAMTLVAPLWPEKEWFADLLLLLTQPPLVLPCWDRLLRQPHCNLFHQGAHALNLHAWRLSSDTTESRAFREGLLESCQGSSENLPLACTSRDGRSSVVGVVEGALLQSTPLYL